MAGPVRIGIIGVGSIGSVHAEAYAQVKRAKVVALCDILPDRLKEKGDRHQIGTLYEDYHKLLASPDIDAISVCVPNNLHRDVAVAAFKAGKHVMLEKPMALSAVQGMEICAARDRAGKVLQMGMVTRQRTEAQCAKEAIDNGQLGTIYHIRLVLTRRRGIPGMGGWFTTKARSGGGPLIDIGVHYFDLAMWLSGLWNPTSVSAMTYAKFGTDMENYHYVSMWAGPPNYDGVFDVEDYACGTVRFGRAATLGFDVGWAANTAGESFLEILGDKGGLRVADGGVTLLSELGGRIADIKLQYPDRGNPFVAEMERYVAAILEDSEPAATGEQGVIAMKLIDGIYRSAAEGHEANLE